MRIINAEGTLLKTVNFCFNKHDNGGEQLILTTNIYTNGDPPPDNLYYIQELKLQSYCNKASFELVGASFTPDLLRQLADELEKAKKEAQKLAR